MEKNKVLRTLSEARKVAGSASIKKVKQYETVLLAHSIYSLRTTKTVYLFSLEDLSLL